MAETLVLLVIAGVIGGIAWLRYRQGGGIGGGGDDALTRACFGDREQAQRLEDLEHEWANEPLSRKQARERARLRLLDDRAR